MNNNEPMRKLTKEDIDFLKEFQKELREQETDGQAFPRYWGLRQSNFVENKSGDCLLISTDGETTKLIETDEDFIAFVQTYIDDCDDILVDEDEKDDFIKELKENYRTITDINDLIIALEHYCFSSECEISYVWGEVENENIPERVFLSKKEAEEHIRLNYYHYEDDVHTYAMTMNRAPKTERALEILYNCNFGE